MISTVGFSQINGVVFKDATTYEKAMEIAKTTDEGGFCKSGDNINTYIFIFPTTSTGIKHCMEKLFEILRDNGLNYMKPTSDKQQLDKSVYYEFDYDQLNTSLEVGSSEILKRWNLDNNWNISLVLKMDYYGIEMSENK